MTLWDYYLQYMTGLCEGTRTSPEGIVLHGTAQEERIAELPSVLSEMSIADFVRRCAEADGTKLSQSLYDEFDENALAETMSKLTVQRGSRRFCAKRCTPCSRSRRGQTRF